MGMLVINEYGRDTREVPIYQSLVRIGRDPRGEAVLGDAGVSRAHSRIVLEERDAVLEDLGSRNGTLLNDEKLDVGERRVLRHGDIIRVGRSVIQFLLKITRRLMGKSGKIPVAAVPPSAAGDSGERVSLFALVKIEPRLLVWDGGSIAVHTLRSDRVRLGRSPDSDVVVSDPTVDDRHAEIVYNREGFQLVDRDSSSGCFVDGVGIRVSRLRHRSYVRLGKLQALFVLREEGKDPPEASFASRDHLLDVHPERAAAIQKAFRECREGGLDFAEELVSRGVLLPEEWWTFSREVGDDAPPGRGGWFSRLRAWGRGS